MREIVGFMDWIEPWMILVPSIIAFVLPAQMSVRVKRAIVTLVIVIVLSLCGNVVKIWLSAKVAQSKSIERQNIQKK